MNDSVHCNFPAGRHSPQQQRCKAANALGSCSSFSTPIFPIDERSAKLVHPNNHISFPTNNTMVPNIHNHTIKIEESLDHGKTLVATQRLDPEPPFGLHVFTDEALLVMPNRDSDADLSGPPPEILKPGPQMWTDWWAYRQLPLHVRQRVLSLYTDMHCPHALAIRSYLYEKDQERQEEEKTAYEFDMGILDHIEEFIRFNMVIRFNSVELCPPNENGTGPGASYGHGLFETACRMSHSCKPNCVWLTTQDGRAKEIRAIGTIEEGEELTIDYVGEALEPVPQRRQELLTTKGFTCCCNRCAAKHDDTRRFPCVDKDQKGCQGAHFLVQPDLGTEPTLLECDSCGAEASQEYLDSMLQKEVEVLQEIRTLSKEEDELEELFTRERADRIHRLEPPHHLHCLAERCYEIKGEFYLAQGEYQWAAQAYANQLKCRTAILGEDYYNQTSAFCCERLGDALRHVNVEEAEEAYKRTFRQITLIRGGIADPYSKCALEKLMDIQYRRAKTKPEELPHQDTVEGIIAGVPGSIEEPDCPCELCGLPSVLFEEEAGTSHHFHYCSEQHQRLHEQIRGVPEEKDPW
eukprot:Nitzschia sp. Nitz4//scaffold82_size85912//33616//35564//NITZ4_005138-RA/size85912-snap-gene-0.132-mRNA-1//1//CDS//3329558826//9287//frame0